MIAWDPQIAVRAIQPVVAALEALGHRADVILADACIPREVLADADALELGMSER